MSRYYKAKDVETALIFSGLCDGKTCGEIKKVLNSIPTINIVRCRECKYSEKTSSPITALWCKRFGLKDMAVEADAFCSYGERKDNES